MSGCQTPRKHYGCMGFKSEVDVLSPKMGRPRSENPKSDSIHVRLDSETKEILEKYCKQEGIPKAEGIRHGMRRLKSEIRLE